MEEILEIAKRAGREIMRVYHAPSFEVEIKKDKSPLTKADRLSHKIILKKLSKVDPDIPIISEEGSEIGFEKRKKWPKFWLVDPLDGTKEFIQRSGEFAVNIALIEKNLPSLGVIYLPVQDVLYYAQKGEGAYKLEKEKLVRLTCNTPQSKNLTAAVSKSHLSKKTQQLLKKLGVVNKITLGSSLKFCQVAEGKADLYPRFSLTWEWDTAAGHSICKEAGLDVIDFKGSELRYNKENLKNEGFVVCHNQLKKKVIRVVNELNNF